jgi:RNA polymerase primary sigma factor
MRQFKISKSITNKEALSLEKYLLEIARIKKSDVEEEAALAKNIREGCLQSLHRLTNANLKFVVSVAKQYQYQGLELSDLINEGNFGLIKAAQKFDETKGFKFISYAVWWIRQSILQSLADQSRIVRIPLNKVGLLTQVATVLSSFEQEHEREPTIEEIALILQVDKTAIENCLSINTKHISVLSPVGDEEDNCLIDILENKNAERVDGQNEHQISLETDVKRALAVLSSKQKEVICCFFGIGMDSPLTLEEIGYKLQLTRERVRQIKDKAIYKLRHVNRKGFLRHYLGN